jgi:hypothetical protein
MTHPTGYDAALGYKWFLAYEGNICLGLVAYSARDAARMLALGYRLVEEAA